MCCKRVLLSVLHGSLLRLSFDCYSANYKVQGEWLRVLQFTVTNGFVVLEHSGIHWLVLQNIRISVKIYQSKTIQERGASYIISGTWSYLGSPNLNGGPSIIITNCSLFSIKAHHCVISVYITMLLLIVDITRNWIGVDTGQV